MGHIDVNCLSLQEQRAKKFVPLVKILGETSIAYLMTKHLTGIVIHKHVENMNLEFRGGRSEKAANYIPASSRRDSRPRRPRDMR